MLKPFLISFLIKGNAFLFHNANLTSSEHHQPFPKNPNNFLLTFEAALVHIHMRM